MSANGTAAVETTMPTAMAVISTNCFLHEIEVVPGFNSRTKFVGIEQLAEAIKERGQLTPLTVGPRNPKTGKYPLLAGERRQRAFKLLDWKEAIRIEVHKPENEVDALLTNLEENVNREDLRTFDIARHCATLEEKGAKRKDIAKRSGYDPKHVGLLVRCYNKLAPEILGVWGDPKAQTEIPLNILAAWSQEDHETQLKRFGAFMAVEEVEGSEGTDDEGAGGGEGDDTEDSGAAKKPTAKVIAAQLAEWNVELKEAPNDEMLKRSVHILRWVLGEVTTPLAKRGKKAKK